MSRLFDAYIVAEWTAAEGRKTGDQSLWIGVVKRDVRFRLAYEAHNPATRVEAEALLRTILADLRKRGQRVLLGFAFPLGFPEGTAARLQLTGEPWAALWKFMASNVVDKADGTNNRFAVAAKMNRLMTDEARPFWGAPARFAQRWLATTKPAEGYGDIPELRRTDRAANARVKGAGKSPWPMHGAGVVGGPALLGVAAARRLTDELGASVAVWPFGTGWRALDKGDLEPIDTLIVEVNTALVAAKAEPGETRTAARVRATAEALGRQDDKGELAKAFAPPADLAAADVAAVQTEEGWVLGA